MPEEDAFSEPKPGYLLRHPNGYDRKRPDRARVVVRGPSAPDPHLANLTPNLSFEAADRSWWLISTTARPAAVSFTVSRNARSIAASSPAHGSSDIRTGAGDSNARARRRP